MNLKRLILILICVLGARSSFAQTESPLVQSRILILLDESSSMIQPWASGKEKYKAAREIILKLMDSVYAVNKDVEFSLRVFGHQHTVPEHDCYDTKNEVAFNRDNRWQMEARLDDIHPLGVTPIAFALTEAANKDLVDEAHNAYSIILITDGGESCGGDICEVMKKLLKYKVYFKPYIVSLENDPSLRVTYACMGDFLQVTKEKDIPKAVSTIVEAFRPVIKLSSEQYTEMQRIAEKAPSVFKVSTPAISMEPQPAKRDTASLAMIPVFSGMANTSTAPAMEPMKTIEVGPLPKLVIATPVKHVAAKIDGITPAPLESLAVAPPATAKLAAITADMPLPRIKVDTVVKRPIDKIAKLLPLRLHQFNVIFVIEDHTYAMRQVPPLPALKGAPVAASQPATGNSHEFKVEATDDRQTFVSVYFTNGTGKFYTTTPQVILLDPTTRKPVRKFFRTVDPDGNPDPQPDIPAGVYDLTLAARPDYMLKGIRVEMNKNNKIIVVVKRTSLSFAYENAPNRPVKEFMAVVTERNKAQGRVQNQKCTEAILYEPGNYHVEINTFPQDVRNVDLDFDGETVITLPQPGFASFRGDDRIQSVMLYRQYGNKFLNFYTLNLKDPRSKKLSIQPGDYQVHYQKPGSPGAMEQVLLFHIRANQETEVILK